MTPGSGANKLKLITVPDDHGQAVALANQPTTPSFHDRSMTPTVRPTNPHTKLPTIIDRARAVCRFEVHMLCSSRLVGPLADCLPRATLSRGNPLPSYLSAPGFVARSLSDYLTLLVFTRLYWTRPE